MNTNENINACVGGGSAGHLKCLSNLFIAAVSYTHINTSYVILYTHINPCYVLFVNCTHVHHLSTTQ